MDIKYLRDKILVRLDKFTLNLKGYTVEFSAKDIYECDVSEVSHNKHKDICIVYYADTNITILKKLFNKELKEIDLDMHIKDIIGNILDWIFIAYRNKFKTTDVYVGMVNKNICIAVPTKNLDRRYKKIKLTSW